MNPRSKHWRYRWKGSVLHVPYAAVDARQNATWCGDGPRILVVRHSAKHPYLQQYYLNWLAREFPKLRALFELRLLPCRVRDWSPYRLYIPWIQDPACDWMPPASYTRALELEAECTAHRIPVINSLKKTGSFNRSVAAEKLTAAGISTPRVVTMSNPRQFRDDLGGLDFPLIVREDRGHGKAVTRVRNRTELDSIALERMRRPIAVQWVDTSAADGMFRKCRFVVAGTVGVRRHLIVSRHWEVRAEKRVASDRTRREELDYLTASAPEHALLERARRALDLQWAAFDYSFEASGEPIIWETNPYPRLSFPPAPQHHYTHPYVERSLAVMTHMYLTAAGLPVPDGIIRRMSFHTSAATASQSKAGARRVA